MIKFDHRRYNIFLLLVAGLGGLLYGIDVGVIAGALPYLEATSGLSPAQLSFIVAAVLLGSVIATLFAGVLADWLGRRTIMIISGGLFVASIPIIALSDGYMPLLAGRLLQGLSAGLIGVTVPLYLAECLPPSSRGRGTAIFQWMLTLGIALAAGIGMYFSFRVAVVAHQHNPAALFAFKNMAWRGIFWTTLLPGVLFFAGAFLVAESPRWLFRHGRPDLAHAALLKSRTPPDADIELSEINAAAGMEHRTTVAESRHEPAIRRESLLRRRYVVPFLLACIILACNQATGINSIIGYNTNILIQAGLTDFQAHEGYLSFAMINFAMTVVGVLLVDRLGRKRLLSIGSAGIVISLLAVGVLFGQAQRNSHDCTAALRRMVHGQSLRVNFDSAAAARLLKESGFTAGNLHAQPVTLNVLYSYGGFTGTTRTVRSDSRPATLIHISRSADVPSNGVIAFFSNPSANLTAARKAPLKIDRAWITPIPSVFHGVLTLLVLLAFVSFFAAGPGVCVWLALSELMPTRIRSSGMSMALVINQSVSTLIAALFLPAVGRYGYADVFYLFAGCTVVYFITAAFFLPETRHKTLEEIERLFQEARTGNEVQPRGASDAI